MSRTKWSDAVQDLTKKLLPRLSSFKRDDPIAFCLTESQALLEHIESFLKERATKSADRARENIKAGDRKLNVNSLNDSRCHYSKAVLLAPSDSDALEIALTNRSHVLYRMGLYRESICDIDAALACPNSNGRNSLELMCQKASCLKELKEYDEAEALFTAALNVTDIENSTREKINEEIYLIQKLKETKGDSESSKHEWQIPFPKNGINLKFPSSSSCLEVLYDENKGRHVVAKCDIQTGDVLFVEKPFSFIAFESVCTNCCEETPAPIPCPSCPDVQFCSAKCRDGAWQSYHRFECGFVNLLNDTGIAYLGLRILFNAASNVDDLKKELEHCSSNRQTIKKNPVHFSRNPYENVFNLQTHIDSLGTIDLLQYALTATLLSLYVFRYTDYGSDADENVGLFARPLLTHVTQLVCNAHAVTGVKSSGRDEDSPVTSEEHRQVASAVYPSASMMNHSCEPSIVNCFHGRWLVVRASKDIKMGEEVYNSYGVHCRRVKRAERQELLRSQYNFLCRCESCTAEHDPYDILNSMKCDDCKGPLVEAADGGGQRQTICLECNSADGRDGDRRAMECEINQLIKDGDRRLYVANDPGSALRSFAKAWTLARRIFYRYHKDLSQCANEIAQCLFLLGDLRRCCAFLKCCLLSVEGRFGCNSIELAFEAKKYGDVVSCYCGEMPPDEIRHFESARWNGLRWYERSEKIFSLLYGSDHPVVEEIRSSKTSLGRMGRDISRNYRGEFF